MHFMQALDKTPEPQEQAVGAPGTRPTQTGVLQQFTFFTATTTNATSTTLNVAGAKKITAFVSRGDTLGTGNSGSEVQQLQVKMSGSGDWVTYNRMIDNVTNSNVQNLTRVANMALAAGTSTKIYSADLSTDVIEQIRCVRIETTDGEGTCSVLVQY